MQDGGIWEKKNGGRGKKRINWHNSKRKKFDGVLPQKRKRKKKVSGDSPPKEEKAGMSHTSKEQKMFIHQLCLYCSTKVHLHKLNN
jgi:hypothetical protein